MTNEPEPVARKARLSALPIFGSWQARHEQQLREVRENQNHGKIVWDIREHHGWGDNISWMDWDKRSLYGHTTPLPKEGDELLSEMFSGRIGRFRFIKVEPCIDPSDMWFGTVEDMDYEK